MLVCIRQIISITYLCNILVKNNENGCLEILTISLLASHTIKTTEIWYFEAQHDYQSSQGCSKRQGKSFITASVISLASPPPFMDIKYNVP